MMLSFWLVILLAFIFRLFRELEDEIARGNAHNWAFSPNSPDASTAKWQFPLRQYKPRWYHFGIHPKFKERFPYSSTLFVWATDAEHFYQFFQTASLCIVAALAGFFIPFAVGLIVAQILKETLKTID